MLSPPSILLLHLSIWVIPIGCRLVSWISFPSRYLQAMTNMNVFLQKVGHFTGDLALQIVHSNECWSVIFERFSGFVYIHVGYDCVLDLHVLGHRSFVGLALWVNA